MLSFGAVASSFRLSSPPKLAAPHPTSPGGFADVVAGTANIDFVIFPERWMVAEHSFRPPWHPMNIMGMGLIHGQYDTEETGFTPGGFSLHNMMPPHGPDAAAFGKASQADLKPVKLTNTRAFMFETRFPRLLTQYAASLPEIQDDCPDCWMGLSRTFNGEADVK